ncbi:hypothetical protein [Merismopedia glauca]|uniref:Uncharacterized protein n=1 Tax=Merismopedia glauca CCAP 1448/3 TaxID=1296344 RepID=A0A2T1C1K1_9CYAN|nr:hypothetical protein [Merismopedia glauca]PSB02149.1 hypothetical protein C7B64_14565 [Merismopedia glauca CCAP 1448/3]
MTFNNWYYLSKDAVEIAVPQLLLEQKLKGNELGLREANVEVLLKMMTEVYREASNSFSVINFISQTVKKMFLYIMIFVLVQF